MIYKQWWKWLAIVMVSYSIVAGFLMEVPLKPILHQTIRNLYFHVPMWFTMLVLYTSSVIYSVKYLQTNNQDHDTMALECVNTGVGFAFLGLTTGMLWAKYTWGDWWSNDPKQNSAAIATLLYLAYLVLRNAIDEEQKRAKVAAIYNVFAFPVMIVLLFILPRLTDSLHPGNGGNPGFNSYDLDKKMRLVFYPACLGWILFGGWLASLRFRFHKLKQEQFENDIK